jgi:hypothetical protein
MSKVKFRCSYQHPNTRGRLDMQVCAIAKSNAMQATTISEFLNGFNHDLRQMRKVSNITPADHYKAFEKKGSIHITKSLSAGEPELILIFSVL